VLQASPETVLDKLEGLCKQAVAAELVLTTMSDHNVTGT
jgi:hypothetical protein